MSRVKSDLKGKTDEEILSLSINRIKTLTGGGSKVVLTCIF